jgi:hypothetical protein
VYCNFRGVCGAGINLFGVLHELTLPPRVGGEHLGDSLLHAPPLLLSGLFLSVFATVSVTIICLVVVLALLDRILAAKRRQIVVSRASDTYKALAFATD